MIISTTPILRTPRWLRASILLCAIGFLPLGLASVDASTPHEERMADKTDVLLHIFGELVATGAMDGKLAFDLYAATVQSRKQELVAAGEMTPEAFEDRLGMAMRLAIARAKMMQAVAEGTMSERDVERKLKAWRKTMFKETKERLEWIGIKKRVEGAVERGEMTREEANAKYERIKERMSSRDRPKDDIRGRIIRALMENGIARESVEGVMGTLRPIIGEMQREGDAFELDPQLHNQLEGMGLTGKQVDVVVMLAQRLASRPTDADRDRRKEWDGIKKHIEGAVERGEITRDESNVKYRGIKERWAARDR